MRATQSASGADFYKQVPAEPYVDDSLKQCPHCSRRFNEDAAAKHFPLCERKAKDQAVRAKQAQAAAKRAGSTVGRSIRKS